MARARRSSAGGKKAEDIKGPLGRRVRELRERAGLSQRELARASGISTVFLGTVERGEKAATVETLEKLARGLRVEPLELFRFSGSSGGGGVDPAERLGRRLATLARNAGPGTLGRFEAIMRAFFDEARTARR